MVISTEQRCHQGARSHMVPTWFGVGTPNSNQLAFVWKCPGRIPAYLDSRRAGIPSPQAQSATVGPRNHTAGSVTELAPGHMDPL